MLEDQRKQINKFLNAIKDNYQILNKMIFLKYFNLYNNLKKKIK